MNLSQYLDQSDDRLAAESVFAANSVVSQPEEYALSVAAANALSNSATNFSNAVQTLQEAEAAYRAAVQAKNQTRENLQSDFKKYFAVTYASSEVSNERLAAAGLPVRNERSGFVTPTEPLDLMADSFSNGSVKLKWKRNGNTTSTIYHIEARRGDGKWELVWSGTQTKAILSGYAPGEQVVFRTYASKGDIFSEDSNMVVIYPEAASQSSRFAA